MTIREFITSHKKIAAMVAGGTLAAGLAVGFVVWNGNNSTISTTQPTQIQNVPTNSDKPSANDNNDNQSSGDKNEWASYGVKDSDIKTDVAGHYTSETYTAFTDAASKYQGDEAEAFQKNLKFLRDENGGDNKGVLDSTRLTMKPNENLEYKTDGGKMEGNVVNFMNTVRDEFNSIEFVDGNPQVTNFFYKYFGADQNNLAKGYVKRYAQGKGEVIKAIVYAPNDKNYPNGYPVFIYTKSTPLKYDGTYLPTRYDVIQGLYDPVQNQLQIDKVYSNIKQVF